MKPHGSYWGSRPNATRSGWHLPHICTAEIGSSPVECHEERGNADPQGRPTAPGIGKSRLQSLNVQGSLTFSSLSIYPPKFTPVWMSWGGGGGGNKQLHNILVSSSKDALINYRVT